MTQRLQYAHSHLGQRAQLFLESIFLLLGGEDWLSSCLLGRGLLFGIPLLILLLIRLVLAGVLAGALETGRFDGRGRRLKAHGQSTCRSQKLRGPHQHGGLHEAQSTDQIHMKGRRQRIAGVGGAGDVTAGLFAERIVQGGDHRRLRRRQQRRQVIEDGIEQGVWIPRTAREQTIVGAPIQKLPPGGANGVTGQMRAQAQEQTVSQTLRTLPGALLRKGGTPGPQQFMEFLQ